MNIIKATIARIEKDRETTKAPCKSYATEAAAEKIAEKLAKDVAAYYFHGDKENVTPMRYMVLFNEAWGRWIVAFDMKELMARSTFTGGYIGVLANKGFYSY